MPDSLQGLLVIVLGLLPGASYIWSFEREVGRWGLGASDRILRFVGVSGLFHALFLPVGFLIWASYFRIHHKLPWWEAAYEVIIAEGAWWLPLLLLAYLALPIALGQLGASSVIRSRQGGGPWWRALARILAGRDPAPRAWDHLFAARPAGIIRLELMSGERVGGIFGPKSYAAGYPEEPQDLFLEQGLLVDQDTGELIPEGDGYQGTGAGILVRWENVKVLEFFETEGTGEERH